MPMLFVGWALNYEMAFYLLFALVLPLATLGGAVLTPTDPVARFYTDPIAFVFDMVLALWHGGAIGGRGMTAAAAMLGGVAVLLAASGASRAPTAGVPALALVAAALGRERRGIGTRWHRLRALGDASSALYLSHLLVLWPLWAPFATLVLHRRVDVPIGRALRAIGTTGHDKPPAC